MAGSTTRRSDRGSALQLRISARSFQRSSAISETSSRSDGRFLLRSPGVRICPPTRLFVVFGRRIESYFHTGNLDVIREAFEWFASWEDCLLSHSDGFIVNYSYYGDWASPEYACAAPETPQSGVTPGILMSTGYSYFNCKTLAFFAGLLGMKGKAVKYADLTSKIQRAFLAKWWNPETAVVATGSQACQAFSLWLGILPEDKRKQAADALHNDLVKNDYRFTTGNLSRATSWRLLRLGYLEDAWKLITSETYPSFGFMSKRGTTIWERSS